MRVWKKKLLHRHIQAKQIWQKPSMQRLLAINAKTILQDWPTMPEDLREYNEKIIEKYNKRYGRKTNKI